MSPRVSGRPRWIQRFAACWAILGVAAFFAAIPACGGGNPATGSLYVMVVDNSNAPVSDATVTTTPATQSLVTDALGSVFFAKVPAGGYSITAIHPTKGSGRIAQQVMAGAVGNATVMLNGIAGTGGAGTGGTGGVGGTGGQVGGTGGQIGGT